MWTLPASFCLSYSRKKSPVVLMYQDKSVVSHCPVKSHHIIFFFKSLPAILWYSFHLPVFHNFSCMYSMNSQYNTGNHLSTSMHTTRHMVVLHSSIHALTHTHYSPVSRRVIINLTAPVTEQSSGCRYSFSCWLVYSVRVRSDHSQYQTNGTNEKIYISVLIRKNTYNQFPIFCIIFSQEFF